MCEKNMMIEFLIFSYFGITKNDAKDFDKALEASSKRAYRDASSHVLSIKDCKANKFTKLIKDGDENSSKKLKEVLKSKGIDIIKNAVTELINAGKEYDEFHLKLCKDLIELYNNYDYYEDDTERKFTYGIAQKWVNMTMKYMNMFSQLFDYGENYNKLKRYKEDFHIPFDSYVFKGLKKIGIDATKDLAVKCWSKIELDEKEQNEEIPGNIKYYQLQKKIRNKIPGNQTPLKWEHEAWIDTANK